MDPVRFKIYEADDFPFMLWTTIVSPSSITTAATESCQWMNTQRIRSTTDAVMTESLLEQGGKALGEPVRV